jgi:hypothetical protein
MEGKNLCPYCGKVFSGQSIICDKHLWQKSIRFSYADFHLMNRGYKFKNITTERVMTKIDVWYKFIERPDVLIALTDNKMVGWERVDVKGWVNGVFQGMDAQEIINKYDKTNYGKFEKIEYTEEQKKILEDLHEEPIDEI